MTRRASGISRQACDWAAALGAAQALLLAVTPSQLDTHTVAAAAAAVGEALTSSPYGGTGGPRGGADVSTPGVPSCTDGEYGYLGSSYASEVRIGSRWLAWQWLLSHTPLLRVRHGAVKERRKERGVC
jgi:hypothetical protein